LKISSIISLFDVFLTGVVYNNFASQPVLNIPGLPKSIYCLIALNGRWCLPGGITMGLLRVSLFGTIRVLHEPLPGEVKLTHRISLLLAYLLLERNRMHPREVLMGEFWGDYSEYKARNCLNTALWRLRRALELDGGDEIYLLTTEGGVGFNCQSQYWLDVAVFEDEMAHVLKRSDGRLDPQAADRLASALQLYRGDLLEGVYEDWAIRAREYQRMLYLSGLNCLVRYHTQRADYDQALEYAQQILRADPLREEIHREVMRLHALQGNRTEAVRQYKACQDLLKKELGIEPMPETANLCTQIMHAGAESDRPAALPLDGSLRDVVYQLHQANRNFDLAQEQLRQALKTMERWLER
jgi:DNA-binding SARP family transcriptional activator